LWEWTEEHLTAQEINEKLLLGTDKYWCTVWQWAAIRGDLELLKQIWEWAKERLTTQEINKELLFVQIQRRDERLALGSKVGQSRDIQTNLGVY
jgi:hypothetical protein